MTVEEITTVAGVYLRRGRHRQLVAAFRLDLRLESRLAANRPYMWASSSVHLHRLLCPLAALSAIEMVGAGLRAKWAACEVTEIYTLVFALNAVSGWFILRRKGWAWVLGSLLGPTCAFPVLRDLVGPALPNFEFIGWGIWLVNYVYGRNRWAEFHNRASAPARQITCRPSLWRPSPRWVCLGC